MWPAMDIDVITPGERLRLAGRLDQRNAAAVRAALHAAVDGGTDELVLDLGALEIWDGTGLGVLVGAARRAQRADRRLVLTDVRPRELRLLRVARVTWTSAVEAIPV